MDEEAIPAAVAKMRQAIALITEAFEAWPKAWPEAERHGDAPRWRRERSTEVSEPPYGGDLQAAMRAQDLQYKRS